MDKQNSLIDSKVFDDLLLKEQVKVLYEGLGSSVIGTLVISTVIYFSNPVMTGVNENAMNWVFLIWIVAILRGIDALFYKKSKLESRSSTSYLARLAIGALMGAASWSILFWNTFPGSSFEFQVYMILVVTGIASFAVTTLSYHLGIILGYLAIAMLPMEILILMESSVFYTPLAVLLPLYLVFQVSGAKRISKNYRHNISLQIEFKLKEKEYMNLQYAVDQHNIVSVSDTNGKIEYANHSLEEISQYSRQELLGNDHGISSSGYHSTSFWKEMWASITSGKVWHGEVKNAAKDGSTYWVESTIVPFVDDHGKPEKYITIRTDITKLKELEKKSIGDKNDALIRAHVSQILQNQGSLKDRMSEALKIISNSPEFNIQNKLGVFLLPENACELEMFVTHGKYTDEFMHREKCVKLGSCLCGRAAVSGEMIISDDCMTDPNHEHTFEGMTAHGHYIVPLSYHEQVLGILFIYTNPYPSRESSRLDTLKFIGDLFALAIANEKVKEELEQARTSAESMVQAKSDFLANMSHEIRTPMNGVLGMLDLLSSRQLDKQSKGYVDIAHGSASMLLNVINDILDISKIESGKLHIESIDFDLRKTVEDSAHLLSELAHQKGLELSCFIPSETALRVNGDLMRLQQVLNNLTGNAIKFTHQGEVKISVHLKSGDKDSSKLRYRFEITDTGIGIPKEKQQSLFQTFTQADTSTSREYGGTGLGLAISKKLIEMMGGEIGVISEEGIGTTFWFELPFDDVTTVESTRRSLNELKILTIDDNETNCLILENYIESWGASNDSAMDPSTGLELLSKATDAGNPFDILLLDMQMPHLSGQDVASVIRKNTKFDGLKIILLSSMSIDIDTDKSQLFDLMLNKPIRQSLLYDAIATVENNSDHGIEINTKVDDSQFELYGNILFVDDNLVNQQVGKEMLLKLGVDFKIVSNGQEAVDATTRNDYDLVLMDCQMPKMDGFEATRQIRSNERTQEIKRVPIVALTANAMAGDREKCIDSGMDDYLSKPYSFKTLFNMLSGWLENTIPENNQNKLDVIVDSQNHSQDIRIKEISELKLSNSLIPEQVELPSDDLLKMDLIDQQKFWETREMMGDSMDSIMTAFKDSGNKNLEDMSQFLELQDIEALRNSVHALKGSCGALGIQRLFERSRITEEKCRLGELSDLESQIKHIKHDYTESLIAIDKILA